MDFDALAAIVCACKIYKDITPIKPGVIENQVGRFLGIYKNIIRLTELNDIDPNDVETVVIVDTRPSKRIDEYLSVFPNLRKCIVIDHHSTTPQKMFPGQILYQKPIGSTTTMLMSIIKKRRVYISPQEATLMLIGIYEDTASLIAPTTKPSDLKIASHLMSLGGNLQVVRRFINSSLSKRGKDVLGLFLDTIEVIPMGGILIAIACVKYPKYVENLAFITHKLFDLVEADAIFTSASFAGKTYFVGRSLDERLVDCSKVLEHFGGGGHKTASAANIKGELPPKIAFSRIKSICEQEIKPPPTVSSVMNYPVKTVTPNETFKIAKEKLKRFGHGGLPVVNNGKLIGIVTRLDLDKVPSYMEDKPVKRFMSPSPSTIEANASIVEARRMMMKKGVGRLPVMEKEKLVGIITRTDVLSADFWHRGQDIGPYPLPTKLDTNQTKELYSGLPEKYKNILNEIREIAFGLSVSTYLVGGAVRDIVLSKNPDDLDILVEGDAINLAQAVSRKLNGKLIAHTRFGTAQLHLPNLKIDFASARAEYYKEPGLHPNVVHTSIYEDLKRRDFTINSLALGLTGDDAWKIIDICGGLDDINRKEIRILHNLSFVEDPTRILRAVYYATNLGFEIEKNTERYAKEAISTGLLSTAKNERTAQELLRILSHKNGTEMLIKLKTLKGIQKIFDRIPQYFSSLLNRIEKIYRYSLELGLKPDLAKLRLLALTKEMDETHVVDVLTRLRIPKRITDQTKISMVNATYLKKAIASGDRIEIFEYMKNESDETIVFSCLTSRLQSSLNLLSRLVRIREVRLEISGDDLINMGLKSGKMIGSVLDVVHKEKIAGRVHGRIEELSMAKRLIK